MHSFISPAVAGHKRTRALIPRCALVTLCSLGAHPALAADTPNDPVETLVVTATPLGQDADKMATIVTTVSRRQILQSGGSTLADALAGEAGVSGSGFAAGASRPVLRGFDANRVRVLENGVGSFDVSDIGADHGVPIDPLSTQEVEVVRGAATLRYGSQAIGGVVNAINRRVPDQLPDTTDAEFVTSYGTNADSWQGAALLDASVGDVAFHVDGFDHHADDYRSGKGGQSNSYVGGNGFAVGSTYFIDQGFLGAGMTRYESRYGIPGGDTYIDLRQSKWMLRSSVDVDAAALDKMTLDAGRADYEHSEIDSQTRQPLATFQDNEWDLRSEAIFKDLGVLSGAALGVQIQNRDFAALGEGADYLQPANTDSKAVFGFIEAPVGSAFTLQAGLRLEKVNVEGTPVNDTATRRRFTPLSASVGLLFAPNDQWRFGATVATAERAPALTELFARGPHDSSSTFEVGDPRLKSERATSIEGNARFELDDTNIQLSLWGADFNDYIFGDLTGRRCDGDAQCEFASEADLRELLYRQSGARFYGAEASGDFALGEFAGGTLKGTLRADTVRATLSHGGNVPRIPPYHLGVGVHWEGDRMDAGLSLNYSGRQSQAGDGETETPEFLSIDAHLGWRPFAAYEDVEVALVAHNLSDTVQRNAASLNKENVVQPGRDLRLVLRAAL